MYESSSFGVVMGRKEFVLLFVGLLMGVRGRFCFPDPSLLVDMSRGFELVMVKSESAS